MSAGPAVREVRMHAAAPDKPQEGHACNGCGVCCAMATCPVGRIVFRRGRRACPALRWQADRYVCGLAVAPGDYLGWLPRAWRAAAGRLVARSIAAGKGCDCDAEVAA